MHIHGYPKCPAPMDAASLGLTMDPPAFAVLRLCLPLARGLGTALAAVLAAGLPRPSISMHSCGKGAAAS